MKIIKTIIIILNFYILDKIYGILFSKIYGKACKHDCDKCAMWSCTYGTKYEKYRIPPYDDFSNVCGKKKNCTK